MRPKIGITCGYKTQKTEGQYEYAQISLDGRFCDLIFDAGGEPVIIPPAEKENYMLPILETLSGIILTGGADIPPEKYGAVPHPETKLLHRRRVTSDFRVAEFADRHELPILGICCGIQEWNVHRGGTLYQHLPDMSWSPRLSHRDTNGFAHHPVRLKEGSLIHSIMKINPLPVNSSHHQGLDRLGKDLVATAWSEDGLVEAVEDPRRPYCLGIQWHPEDMPYDPLQDHLFDSLVAAAKKKCPSPLGKRVGKRCPYEDR